MKQRNSIKTDKEQNPQFKIEFANRNLNAISTTQNYLDSSQTERFTAKPKKTQLEN